MTTPITPPDPPTEHVAAAPRASRWRPRWRRPRGRGAVIGVAVLALLVVAGVAAALLIPGDGPGRGGHGGPRDLGRGDGPCSALPGGQLDGLEGRTGHGGQGHDGPHRGGPLERGLAATRCSPAPWPPRPGTRSSSRPTAARSAQSVPTPTRGCAATATRPSATCRVTGTVTASTGTTATVTAIDGMTVAADVTALSRKPAVGDLVVLTGVTTNGTTLTADGIRLLPRAS